MTVYLVSDGSYSDYKVLGVYSTRELADEAVKRFGADNDVEEYEIDAMPTLPDGLYGWRVMFHGDEIVSVKPNGVAHEFQRKIGGYCNGVRHPPTGTVRCDVTVICLARDEDHAMAVAIEQRPRIIAEWGQQTPKYINYTETR